MYNSTNFDKIINEIFLWIIKKYSMTENIDLIQIQKISIFNKEFMQLFRKFKYEFRKTMFNLLEKNFREHHLDFTKFKQYKKINIYIRTMSGYFLFYLIWLRLNNILFNNEEINNLLESVALGTLGYRILDLHFDEAMLSNQEVLLGLELIQKHEKILFNIFGCNNSNFDLVYQSKIDYFNVEIKEKEFMGVRSPYTFDKSAECGYKIAPAFSLFALALNKICKSSEIETYKRIFYNIFATVQIMDDLYDLKDDLNNKIFTLVVSGIEDNLKTLSPIQIAETIYKDKERLTLLHNTCWQLLRDASKLAENIDDPLMMLFAEYQLNIIHKFFFGKEVLYGTDQV